MSYPRKHRPFSSLSRRKRRKKALALKYLIQKARQRCGGIFYDPADFRQFENQVSEHAWHWSDILFSGRDPAQFWNAEIITARVAFSDAVSSRAFDEAWQQLNEQARAEETRLETRPNYNAEGKLVSRTLLSREKPKYDFFGGLTFSAYVEQREQVIAHEDPPVIYRRYQFLPDYAYGTGLRIVVDAPALSRQIIEEAIADFRARGEKEWRSSEPVSLEA